MKNSNLLYLIIVTVFFSSCSVDTGLDASKNSGNLDQDITIIEENDTENYEQDADIDEDPAQESDIDPEEVEAEGVEENVRVSGCRGFDNSNTVSLKSVQRCDQSIIWKYNNQEGVLNIVNQDIMLNCCGEHDVRIEKGYKSIKYIMIDNPENDARCGCSCLFDYSADVKIDLEDGITLAVFTDIAEDEGLKEVWEGRINLSEGSGAIVIKERSGDDCFY